jgi:hypothetical protein
MIRWKESRVSRVEWFDDMCMGILSVEMYEWRSRVLDETWLRWYGSRKWARKEVTRR